MDEGRALRPTCLAYAKYDHVETNLTRRGILPSTRRGHAKREIRGQNLFGWKDDRGVEVTDLFLLHHSTYLLNHTAVPTYVSIVGYYGSLKFAFTIFVESLCQYHFHHA